MSDRERAEAKTQKIAPKDARTFKQRCTLQREVCWRGDTEFMLTHQGLVISKGTGLARNQITLSRSEFERFVHFYEKGQRIRKVRWPRKRRKNAK